MVSRALVEERVTAEVIRLCHAGRSGPDLLTAVVDRIRPAVPYDFWCASTTDPFSGLMTTALSATDLATPDARATFERLYFEHYLDEARAMARERRPVALLSQTSDGDVRRSPRWRELLGPAGLGDELRGAFCAGGRLWGMADLARAGDRSFTPGETALLRRLIPHVAEGLRVAALLRDSATARTTPRPSSPGVLVLDRDGRVLQATPAAERLLADLEDLAPGWREPSGLPLAVRMLVAALRRTLRPERERDREEPPRLRLRGRSGTWLTLHAALTEVAPDRTPEVVVVLEPSRPEDLLDLMPAAYGLSPREREIAVLVARGASSEQIAAALHLSEYTVQNHLSRVFDKVGVRNRTALVRRLFLDVLHPAVLAGPGSDEERTRRIRTT